MTTYSKIPLLNDIVVKIRQDVVRQVTSGMQGDAPALLLLLKLSEDQTQLLGAYPRDVSDFHEDERSKDILAGIMNDAFTDPASPVNALIYTSEAWTVTRHADDGPPDVQPRDDPNRKEAVVVVIRTATTTEIVSFALDKVNRTVTDMDSVVKATGRMVGSSVPQGETVH
jgi:hypothetical protein